MPTLVAPGALALASRGSRHGTMARHTAPSDERRCAGTPLTRLHCTLIALALDPRRVRALRPRSRHTSSVDRSPARATSTLNPTEARRCRCSDDAPPVAEAHDCFSDHAPTWVQLPSRRQAVNGDGM